MRKYKKEITLNRNSRGCYILDTIKGCNSCLRHNKKGCYDDCYANKIADRYGFDFSESTKRDIKRDTRQFYLFGLQDEKHSTKLINQIKEIKMPFIRIGEMGDPSEDWEHTLNVCKIISKAGKKIVIITKHWNNISDKLLEEIKSLNLCINTSISALDNDEQIHNRLSQFYKLKNYCNSMLRIVSCDFNMSNEEGICRSAFQEELFKYTPNIDTIFRPSLNNPLIINKVINIKKVRFLNANVWASVNNGKTYFGECERCPDMCGIGMGK